MREKGSEAAKERSQHKIGLVRLLPLDIEGD